jgi:hypothetical protein
VFALEHLSVDGIHESDKSKRDEDDLDRDKEDDLEKLGQRA